MIKVTTHEKGDKYSDVSITIFKLDQTIQIAINSSTCNYAMPPGVSMEKTIRALKEAFSLLPDLEA